VPTHPNPQAREITELSAQLDDATTAASQRSLATPSTTFNNNDSLAPHSVSSGHDPERGHEVSAAVRPPKASDQAANVSRSVRGHLSNGQVKHRDVLRSGDNMHGHPDTLSDVGDHFGGGCSVDDSLNAGGVKTKDEDDDEVAEEEDEEEERGGGLADISEVSWLS
jgi:hypothetical protein